MAKLDGGRMSDATKVKQCDDVHRQFETDLEDIFGIPDNTDIANPVFGENPEVSGSAPVNSDGSITGVPIFKLSSPAASAAGGVGFEFDDGTKKKRIVFVESELRVYEEVDGAWTQVANLENPTGGSGLLTSLSDMYVNDPLDSGDAGKVLRVRTSSPYEFELVSPAQVGGVTEFVNLDDVATAALLSGDVGKVVTVQDQGGGVYKLDLAAAPAGVGDPWVMWLKANSVTNWVHEKIQKTTTAPWQPDAADGWANTWNWSYPYPSQAELITDSDLLTAYDPGGSDTKLNYYVTIPVGVYRVAFWYEAESFNIKGTREFRMRAITGVAIDGGALYADQNNPPVNYEPGESTPVGGIHHLGTKDLIVTTEGTFTFQVRQNSDAPIAGSRFYASITKVK